MSPGLYNYVVMSLTVFIFTLFCLYLLFLDNEEDIPISQNEYVDSLLSEDCKKSWWFHFCIKIRSKEAGPGWEPGFWQNICPYPFCPTYRHFAHVMSLCLVGLMTWGIVYCIMGQDAAPGGQLFDIAVLCIAANFGGFLFRIMNLPGLLGMIIVGITFQNFGLVHVDRHYAHFSALLRKVALVIILTRAGLDMNPEELKNLIFTVLRLALVPWFVDCAFAAIFGHYLLRLPWMWAILMGSIIGAVSPAVIVPSLIRLRKRGYGVAKGIPTMVIAVAGIDDAASVAAFGIIYSIMFSKHTLMYNILLGPFSLLIGVVYGIGLGILAKYVPEKDDAFAVPLRILMLLSGGLIAVFGSEKLGIAGAGPLGVVVAGFCSSCAWSTNGWKIEDNPVVSVFGIFWMLFEPILFSLTGTQIKMDEIDPRLFTSAVFGLIVGVIIRIVLTVLIAMKTSLNLKEKLCCAFFWMNKASVQAALGPFVVDSIRKRTHTKSEIHYADVILMVCVLSIVLTAPVGSIIISCLGSQLLTKTIPGHPSLWKSTLASLHEITVDEDELTDWHPDSDNYTSRSLSY